MLWSGKVVKCGDWRLKEKCKLRGRSERLRDNLKIEIKCKKIRELFYIERQFED